MIDLVKRLRTMAATGWNPIGDEAADTITALRAENERLKGFEAANRLNAAQVKAQRAEVERLTGERDRQYDQNAEQIIRISALEDENERLKKEALFTAISVLPEKDAENERLRAALEEIDSINVHSGGDIHGVHPSAWEVAFKQAQDTARAALGENTND